MSGIVYLEVCCLKRPFDDAAQERVRREAEAVAAVLDAAARGRIRLVHSPAHDVAFGLRGAVGGKMVCHDR